MLCATIGGRHRTRGLKDISWNAHGYLAASAESSLGNERPQICQRHSYDEALLQSCPTLCDPMDCSPPFPLLKGFSR